MKEKEVLDIANISCESPISSDSNVLTYANPTEYFRVTMEQLQKQNKLFGLLTVSQMMKIIAAHKEGVRMEVIAYKLGVRFRTVRLFLYHPITIARHGIELKKRRPYHKHLSYDKIIEIYKASLTGDDTYVLAGKFDQCYNSVRKAIKKGKLLVKTRVSATRVSKTHECATQGIIKETRGRKKGSKSKKPGLIRHIINWFKR